MISDKRQKRREKREEEKKRRREEEKREEEKREKRKEKRQKTKEKRTIGNVDDSSSLDHSFCDLEFTVKTSDVERGVTSRTDLVDVAICSQKFFDNTQIALAASNMQRRASRHSCLLTCF